MPGVRSRPDAIAIPPSERRLLFRLQAEHALYPARSQSPPAPAHNPLSLPVSQPHPRLAPSADTLVMVVCLLPGGTQVCPSGRSQPPDSGSSPGGNRPLRLRHHHTALVQEAEWEDAERKRPMDTKARLAQRKEIVAHLAGSLRQCYRHCQGGCWAPYVSLLLLL